MVSRETPQGGCLGSGKRLELDDHREMTWASPPHISVQIPAKKAGSTPGPIGLRSGQTGPHARNRGFQAMA